MKELAGTSANIFYEKLKDGTTAPIFEIIVITSEPDYVLTNEHDLVKTRAVKTLRFFVRDVDRFAASLIKIKNDLLEQEKKTDKPNS